MIGGWSLRTHQKVLLTVLVTLLGLLPLWIWMFTRGVLVNAFGLQSIFGIITGILIAVQIPCIISMVRWWGRVWEWYRDP